MDRKEVDLALKHLREDGKIYSPKRGHWSLGQEE